jgi:Fe2+ transport system protein FeoA
MLRRGSQSGLRVEPPDRVAEPTRAKTDRGRGTSAPDIGPNGLSKASLTTDYPAPMELDQAPAGVRVVVESSRAATTPVTRRLAELGIRRGATLTMLSRTSGGGAILAIGDDRIAVSGEILRSTLVTPISRAAVHG